MNKEGAEDSNFQRLECVRHHIEQYVVDYLGAK